MFKKRKSKRAQIVGQIFIYAISIIVVTLILAYGYKAIRDFSKRGEEVAYITLRSNFQNAFKSIVSDYGTIKRPDFDVPGKFKRVCLTMPNKDPGSPLCQTGNVEHEPIVCAGWETGRDNVYLVPDGSQSFSVGDITIEGGRTYLCFDVINGKIKMQLKSLGDKVEVSCYDCEPTPA
jgi:hypothetical protein